MPQANIKARLCPECANSISPDAPSCPYCKADLARSPAPQWPERSGHAHEQSTGALDEPFAPEKQKLPLRSKLILAVGLLVFALGVYLVGGTRERSDLSPKLEQLEQELQSKDQRIQTLEEQLKQLRWEHQGSSSRLEELKARLDESEKDLSLARRKLAEANREIDRLASSRIASAPRPTSRAPNSTPAQPPVTASRRAAEPGVYETVRPTTVYEEPSASSRAVAQIGKGTDVTVVRSVGEWLEVRSKHGNPPGYIRADDARVIRPGN